MTKTLIITDFTTITSNDNKNMQDFIVKALRQARTMEFINNIKRKKKNGKRKRK